MQMWSHKCEVDLTIAHTCHKASWGTHESCLERGRNIYHIYYVCVAGVSGGQFWTCLNHGASAQQASCLINFHFMPDKASLAHDL